MADIDRAFGRRAFGEDAAAYDAVRPAYPDWVFATLRERCSLAPGAAVFEVGAGTGIATRRLLDDGAAPLVAIEPDPRLAAYLRSTRTDTALQVVVEPFESVELPTAAFDLGVCATAFHWLDESSALAKAASLLKSGGWWAMVWNVFGDPARDDLFHDATVDLFADEPRSPSSGGAGETPFALQTDARLAAFDQALFELGSCEARPWELVLDADQTVAFYATYSNITVRPKAEQQWLFDGLRRIAVEQFGGRVVRNMVTVLYTARRR